MRSSLEEAGSHLVVDDDAVAGAALVRVKEARYGKGQVRLTAIECEAAAEVLLSAASAWRAKYEPRVTVAVPADLDAAEHGYRPEGEAEVP